jgi:hypothetical protein
MTITFQIDGTNYVITEGAAADWDGNGAADNDTAATNLVTALEALQDADGNDLLAAQNSNNILHFTTESNQHLEKITVSDATGMTFSELFAAPEKVIQFLAYQDRLLSIDNDNPGELRWSESFNTTEWETRGNTGVRPDTKLNGMIIHAMNNANTGKESKVLLAGDHGMYLFWGTRLSVITTIDVVLNGDYQIFPLGVPAGCSQPKTMVSTPKGTIWLGNDKNVYFLPYDSAEAVVVSDKNVYFLPYDSAEAVVVSDRIKSKINNVNGLENINTSDMINASAVYHDGFYKLSFSDGTNTNNNIQFWLDVNRLFKDENELVGPWYGPMTGQFINIFFSDVGPSGGETLYGASATTSGQIYTLHNESVFADTGQPAAHEPAWRNVVGTTLTAPVFHKYQTYYNNFNNTFLNKDIHRLELVHENTDSTLKIGYRDIKGGLKLDDTEVLVGSAKTWDGNTLWDGNSFWDAPTPTRTIVEVSPNLNTRELSLFLTGSSKTEKFLLYGINAEVKERNFVFE